MIPVNDSELIRFDFKNEAPKYQKLLVTQFIFCDNNKKRIIRQAEDTYNKVTIQEEPFFVRISCNFKLLEEKCIEYLAYMNSIEEIAITKEIDE